MKCTKPIFFCIVWFFVSTAQGQDQAAPPNKEILAEGIFLYRLEKASWHATDVLTGTYNQLLGQLNGYLSYIENKNTKTIFWNKENQVMLTVTFDSVASAGKGTADDHLRPLSVTEKELVTLRTKAFDLMMENKDEFFSFYEKTSPNLIPVMREGKRMVFILTGSQGNELLIGNDYRLDYNEDSSIKSKTKLHNSLIRLPGESPSKDGKKSVGSVHSHIIKDLPFMTSTDICTFLLYKDVFKMKDHTTISDKWLSILNTDRVTFVIVPGNYGKNK